MLMSILLNGLGGLNFAPDNGAGDSGGGQAGQDPAPTDDNGGGQASPGGDSGEPAAPGQEHNLVDVTAVDENGNLQWFPASEVKKLRDEAAKWRTQYQDANGRLEALQANAPEPDAEPATAEFEQQISTQAEQINTLRVQNAVLAEAARNREDRAAFIDPEDAVRLADLSSVEIGEDGTVTGVAEAIQALAAAKPHLLRSPQGAAGAVQRASNPARSATLTLEEIQRMTPQQIMQRKDEVTAALRVIRD